MASSSLPGGSRHVGRVIDPSVREDGDPEPELELAQEPAKGAAAPETRSDHDSSGLPRGGRAREVLLERAQAARNANAEPSGPSVAELDEIGQPELDALASERQPAMPGQRAPSAPERLLAPGRLSPTLVAVFGTLLGVATVSSLVALGMNVDMPLSNSASAPNVKSTASAALAPPPVPRPVRVKQPGPWRVADARGEAGTRLVEAKVGTEPFLKALETAGVATRETYRVLTAMKGVRDFDHCKSSDRFAVLIERGSSKVKAFEYMVSAEEVYQAREGADGYLKGTRLDLKVERKQVTAALMQEGKSLDASAPNYGLEPGIARALAKALDGHESLDDIEQGSRIRVIAQEVSVLGEFARYSGIEALEIVPPGDGKERFRLYYFEGAGERGYFDADGHATYEGGWRKPIPTAPMTSPYNLKRMHPILKKIMPHLGIDFGAPVGTPVGASSYGTVSFVGFLGPTGNLVKIAHSDGVETGYAHLSRFADGLKVGDKVKRLQTIGYVGSTGRSTGPHLHFLARKNGEFIDPATLNLDSMRTISKENRDAFLQVKAKYDAALDAIALPPAPVIAAPPKPAESVAAAAPPSDTTATPATADSAAPAANNADVDSGDEVDENSAKPASATTPNQNQKSGSSVYLSDKELLQLQGSSDDGEVE